MLNLSLSLHGSTLQKPGVFLAQLWKSIAEHASEMSTAHLKSIQMAWLTFWITLCSLKRQPLHPAAKNLL